MARHNLPPRAHAAPALGGRGDRHGRNKITAMSGGQAHKRVPSRQWTTNAGAWVASYRVLPSSAATAAAGSVAHGAVRLSA